jgi:hypothetical protein
LACLAGALLATALLPVVAAAQTVPYLGASLGASFYNTGIEKLNDKDFKLQASEMAWKLFGGIRSARYLAVEGGFVNLGQVKHTGRNVELKTSGWDLFGVVNLQAGPLEVFGKLGALWWRAETKIDENPFDTDGHDLAWGFGGSLRYKDTSVRIEWEQFQLGDGNSIGLATFGIAMYF